MVALTSRYIQATLTFSNPPQYDAFGLLPRHMTMERLFLESDSKLLLRQQTA
jgi:hypothetical protein